MNLKDSEDCQPSGASIVIRYNGSGSCCVYG